MCVVVGNLPTVISLSCYACIDYPGSSQPCSNPSVINCDFYFDTCVSFDATLEFSGMSHTIATKNCSVSQICNSNVLCDQVNSTLPAGSMKKCSTTCCSGSLCNGHGGQGSFVYSRTSTNGHFSSTTMFSYPDFFSIH